MKYITAKEAAQKWGITLRRVQDMCRGQAIDGAVRWGRDWMIPADTNRPADRRRKQVNKQVETLAVLPRKNPAIIFSNIYNTPGTADAVADNMTERPVAAQLFRAQIAFCRGDMEGCRIITESLFEMKRGHDLQIGCGVVLSLCGLFTGNDILWKRGLKEITTAHCHDTRDHMAVDFWQAAVQCEIREADSFPLWFTRGQFDILPGDSFPGARFYYLRYLYLKGREYITNIHGNIDMRNIVSMFSCVAEPLVAQSHKEGALISEMYLRLICACAYHDLGNDPMAIHHLDIALDLALPDRLYIPLAEYRRQLDFLMDQRLMLKDPAAAARVKTLNQKFLEGWTVIHNAERGKTVSNELTTREREVAKMASFGLSNKEIAERLNISINTVKQSLRIAMDKTGAMRRNELSHYI